MPTFARSTRLMLFACGLLFACGQQVPPLESLELRDALNVAPEVIAAMSLEHRARLRERFIERLATKGEDTKADEQDVLRAVTSVDARLAREGADAQLSWRLQVGAAQTEFNADTLATQASKDSPSARYDLADVPTPLEQAALEGDLGRALYWYAQAQQVTSIRRVVGWPVALTLDQADSRLYVNAAFVAAMADPTVVVETAPPAFQSAMLAQAMTAPVRQSAPVVREFTSLATCTAQTKTRCSECQADPDTCDETAMLIGYGNGLDECVALLTDETSVNTIRYCRANALQRATVKACMTRNSSTCVSTSDNTRDPEFLIAFAKKSECTALLENCTQDPSYVKPKKSCSGCNPSCNPTCKGPTCSSPNCNTPNGSCTGCSCGSNGKLCSQTPHTEQPMPWLSLASLLAPLAFTAVAWRGKGR